tara:strand:- start:155 stop:319 length:165 start_codon:yes stop_codon:yes gene_type:complete
MIAPLGPAAAVTIKLEGGGFTGAEDPPLPRKMTAECWLRTWVQKPLCHPRINSA